MSPKATRLNRVGCAVYDSIYQDVCSRRHCFVSPVPTAVVASPCPGARKKKRLLAEEPRLAAFAAASWRTARRDPRWIPSTRPASRMPRIMRFLSSDIVILLSPGSAAPFPQAEAVFALYPSQKIRWCSVRSVEILPVILAKPGVKTVRSSESKDTILT